MGKVGTTGGKIEGNEEGNMDRRTRMEEKREKCIWRRRKNGYGGRE